jgi:hypothetical protein
MTDLLNFIDVIANYLLAHDSFKNLMLLKPSTDDTKYLFDPITNEEITQINKILILSNDPNDLLNDILNDKLYVYMSQKVHENKLYSNQIRKQIDDLSGKLALHEHIVLNTINSNILRSTNILGCSEDVIQSQLDRIKTGIRFLPNEHEKYNRIFVIIIDSKHDITESELNKKIKEIEDITFFFKQCKIYYDVVKDLNNITDKLSFCRNRLRILNDKTELTQDEKEELIRLYHERDRLYSIKNAIYCKIAQKLRDVTDEQDWHDYFERFCNFYNFNFSSIIISFLDETLCLKENLKNKLKELGYVVISGSHYKFEIS